MTQPCVALTQGAAEAPAGFPSPAEPTVRSQSRRIQHSGTLSHAEVVLREICEPFWSAAEFKLRHSPQTNKILFPTQFLFCYIASLVQRHKTRRQMQQNVSNAAAQTCSAS